MNRQIGRKTWPLVIGGLVALAVLSRYSGVRRRTQRTEEARDGA
jgi:hypothetical protein